MNLRYQDNLGHLNGYDFFNVSDQSNFQSDNPSNYYSEHSGSHVFETYCSNSQGGEIFYPETGGHIIDDSECMQYGDCEFLTLEGDSYYFLYSSASTVVTQSQCIEYSNESDEIITRFIPAQIRLESDAFVPMNNFISSSILYLPNSNCSSTGNSCPSTSIVSRLIFLLLNGEFSIILFIYQWPK